MKLHVNFIRSSNGRRDVACYVYMPEGEVRGIVQIAHGMCDYVENYALLAQFLTSKGILVCGNDHLGHGNSAENRDDLGYFGKGGYATLLKDMHRLNKMMRAKYKTVPYVLLGHSMGSILARAYAVAYPDSIEGAIFVGTAGANKLLRAGQMLAASIAKTRGGHYRSKLLYSASFGAYGAKFPGEGEFAWLSRDKATGEKFAGDAQRNFIFTASGYHALFTVMLAVEKPQWAAAYPTYLPTLIASGDKDPVGENGKGPTEVCQRLREAAVHDVTLKLYPGARHELHSEINKEEFFEDVFQWIETHCLTKA